MKLKTEDVESYETKKENFLPLGLLDAHAWCMSLPKVGFKGIYY